MKSLYKNLVLGLATVFIAVFSMQAYSAAPLEVKGATTIDTNQAKQMWMDGALFLDPRTKSDYEVGHIPKAIHINRTNPEVYTAKNIIAMVDKVQPVVVYCNGVGCLRSARTSADLVSLGYQKVYYYRDGFPAWTFSGHPVE